MTGLRLASFALVRSAANIAESERAIALEVTVIQFDRAATQQAGDFLVGRRHVDARISDDLLDRRAGRDESLGQDFAPRLARTSKKRRPAAEGASASASDSAETRGGPGRPLNGNGRCFGRAGTDRRQPDLAQRPQVAAAGEQSIDEGLDAVGTGEDDPLKLGQALDGPIDRPPIGRWSDFDRRLKQDFGSQLVEPRHQRVARVRARVTSTVTPQSGRWVNQSKSPAAAAVGPTTKIAGGRKRCRSTASATSANRARSTR